MERILSSSENRAKNAENEAARLNKELEQKEETIALMSAIIREKEIEAQVAKFAAEAATSALKEAQEKASKAEEEPKAEEPKVEEEPKAEEPKVEEEPKAEESKVEEPKVEEPKQEVKTEEVPEVPYVPKLISKKSKFRKSIIITEVLFDFFLISFYINCLFISEIKK